MWSIRDMQCQVSERKNFERTESEVVLISPSRPSRKPAKSLLEYKAGKQESGRLLSLQTNASGIGFRLEY
jgi:hypothetical protein